MINADQTGRNNIHDGEDSKLGFDHTEDKKEEFDGEDVKFNFRDLMDEMKKKPKKHRGSVPSRSKVQPKKD